RHRGPSITDPHFCFRQSCWLAPFPAVPDSSSRKGIEPMELKKGFLRQNAQSSAPPNTMKNRQIEITPSIATPPMALTICCIMAIMGWDYLGGFNCAVFWAGGGAAGAVGAALISVPNRCK